MGHRANYIIKAGHAYRVHYSHWRAQHITEDLYLGVERFLGYVMECQQMDNLLSEVWVEGCVVVDTEKRQLAFFQLHVLTDTTLEQYYLAQLARKWPGWEISLLRNRMYDVAQMLGIDYVSRQEWQKPYTPGRQEVIDDKAGELDTALVIIRWKEQLFITRTGNLSIEAIVGYGEEIIPLLSTKAKSALPLQESNADWEVVIVDVMKKQLWINKSEFGLWEQSRNRWGGYDLHMGDYGFLQIMQLAGVEHHCMPLTEEEVKKEFAALVAVRDTYDPGKTMEKLLKEHKEVQYNPMLFDRVQPRKTFLEIMKATMMKLIRH